MANSKPVDFILNKVQDSRILGVFLTLFLFVVYIPKCCQDYYWTDSAEFAFIAPIWGLAHPTGYPLYSMITGLLSLLPFPIAFLLSLLSALFTVLAMLCLFRILLLLELKPIAALFVVTFVAIGRSLMDQSTIAEVYTLHLLMQMLVVYFLLKWRKTAAISYLWSTCFCFGLSFTNHLSSAWLVIPIALLFYQKKAILKDKKQLLFCVASFMVGLLPYLYLIIRANSDPLYNQNDPSSLSSFLSLITGSIFSYRMFALNSAEFGQQVELWWESLLAQWHFISLLFLPLGLYKIYKSVDKYLFGFFLSWLLIGLISCWNYFIPDKEGYYLLPHLLLAIPVAIGFLWLTKKISLKIYNKQAELIVVVFSVMVVAGLLYNGMDNSRRINTSLRDITVDSWKHLDHSTLMITEDINLHYGTLLLQRENVLPDDVAVVSLFLLGFEWYHDFLRKNYPSIKIPRKFPELAGEFEDIESKNKYQFGDKKQQHVERMAILLIRENIALRPIAIYLVDNEYEADTYLGYNLLNCGLTYKISSAGASKVPQYKCDFAAKYLVGKDKLTDERERHLASSYATACNRLGISYVNQNKPHMAIDVFKKTLRYDPDYSQAMKNMGLVYVKQLRNIPEGRKIWQKYVKLAGEKADNAVIKWLKSNKAEGK